MLVKIIPFLTFFINLLDPSSGHNVNTFFNLSSVEYQGSYVIKIFKINFLNETFPLPFSANDYMYLQQIFEQETTGRKFIRSQNLIIKIADNKWNKSMEMYKPLQTMCKKRLFYLEVHIDDVLNAAFECRNRVSGYVSRFNYCKSANGNYYQDKVYVDWITFNKKQKIFKNNRNYQKFFKDCHSFSNSLHFMVTGGIFFILLIFMIIALWFLEKIKVTLVDPQSNLNPIIMVTPINNDDA